MAEFWNSQSPRTKMTIFLAAIAAAIVAVVILGMGNNTSYSLLARDLDPTTSVKITQELKAANIAYETSAGGATISVASGRIDDARAIMVEKNLVSGQVGWEIFDKTKLGATDFQQQVMYQRALEGEIARTLSNINGVKGATVNLAIPETRVFQQEQQPTTASVLLQLDGGMPLDPTQVRAISQLVANAVPKLDPKNVTITDGSGTLLWGGQGNGFGGMAGDQSQIAVQGLYERQMETGLSAMLGRVLGPDKIAVKVNADLNLDKKKIEMETWGKRVQPLTTSNTNEIYKGNGSPPGGIPGTNGNTAPATYGIGQNGGVSTNYRKQQSDIQNAIDKTLTSIEVAPGEVKRQTVSVLVDSSVPKAQLGAIEQSVRSAIGYDQARGDVVTVSAVKFAPVEVPVVTKPETPFGGPIVGKLMDLLPLIGAVIVGLFLFRNMRKSTRQTLTLTTTDLPRGYDPATGARELDTPGAGELPDTEVVIPDTPLSREALTREAVKRQAISAAEKAPRESGLIVAKWMGDDS